MSNSGRKDDKDTSSVDYSTIERDYGSSNANTLTKGSNHMEQDGELISLPNNRGNSSNLTGIMGEITTKNINGPGTYRPNEYSNRGGGVLDLPNIDIDYKKPPSNRIPSTNFSYQNQLDSMDGQRQRPPSNKIQFPDKTPPDIKTRYVSNENIHLQQIVQDSGFLNNMLDEEPENDGGGVTVVSARTPARFEQQGQKHEQSNKYASQAPQHQQPPPPKQYPGHLSLSQRIETTSTPLQIPISSSSLRNQTPLLPNSSSLRGGPIVNKDGATDV
jgi:hypothetical protein